ncbi:TIGR03751 family conjugal transfer lipoprotein [Pseudomonas caricapapayae]|nr:TIGR03751 family conjugal transfer lipoprotein [Pseudomonas caricapapayae]
MSRLWINTTLGALAVCLVLAGCSTTKDEMLPHGDNTMMDIWTQGTGGGSGSVGQLKMLDARQQLRRPLTGAADLQGKGIAAEPSDASQYTRTAQNEIYSQFRRLPNPDLVMYVFPHMAGSDPAPVPGYSTVFPLYQRVQYAMPGERTEDY